MENNNDQNNNLYNDYDLEKLQTRRRVLSQKFKIDKRK